MPQEIESRLINSGESDTLLPKSELVQLLKDLADQSTHRQQLALARSDAPTTPTVFDYFDEVLWTLMSMVAEKVHKPTNTCYENVGCFERKDNMSLPYGGPMSPKEVGTLFFYFTNASRTEKGLNSTIWKLDNWTLQSMGDWKKLLVVITHGFTGDINTPWLMPLVYAFLDNVDCNVIVADWRRGAEGPKYPTAAANTPMVGVEISMLLQKIIKATNCTLSPDNITLVGFSLGAHVVGFAGRHFYKKTTMKLDRIIGLDPAGALFEGTKVSLSHRDAKYVDVIHTNGGPIWTFKLAFSKPMGHVDFYPNGGSNQPNCSIYPKINITVLKTANSSTEALLSILESMACSHYRAPELLKESLTNRNCNFTSYPCPEGWQNFKNCSERFKHNKTVIGLMGYYSYTRQGKGVQYLKTNNATPYCIPETDKSAEVCR